jgi:hypothetical protein
MHRCIDSDPHRCIASFASGAFFFFPSSAFSSVRAQRQHLEPKAKAMFQTKLGGLHRVSLGSFSLVYLHVWYIQASKWW